MMSQEATITRALQRFANYHRPAEGKEVRVRGKLSHNRVFLEALKAQEEAYTRRKMHKAKYNHG